MVRGTEVPAGADVEWFVRAGVLTTTPVPEAEPLPGRYVAVGLVDAHCHLTLRGTDAGPVQASPAEVRAVVERMQQDGVLALRDTGAPDQSVVELSRDADAAVQAVACGRFLAPPGQYFPEVFEGVPAEEVVAAAVAQIHAGATWVKVVADFPRGADFAAPAVQNYPTEVVAALCDAVHAAGGRVAAHVTLPIVRELVEAGIDSVEHGVAMQEDDLPLLAARGVAWTPTLSAVIRARPDAPAEWLRVRDERAEMMRTLLPRAVALGIPVLAGSDVAAPVIREVARLAAYGLRPVDALAAAASAARTFLGFSGLVDGAAADLVCYDADPRDDPAVLARPVAVLSRGRRIR